MVISMEKEPIRLLGLNGNEQDGFGFRCFVWCHIPPPSSGTPAKSHTFAGSMTCTVLPGYAA